VGDNRGHVLLAEDNDDYRTILTDYLRHVGFEVSSFSGGAALLEEAFARRPPFVVLTDLFMPGVSGFDVVAELRAANLLPVVPTAVHSAFAWEAFPEPDVLAISKPADLGDLALVLDCLCADAAERVATADLRFSIERKRRAGRAG
jgi:CheY-like chemotaxis protein